MNDPFQVPKKEVALVGQFLTYFLEIYGRLPSSDFEEAQQVTFAINAWLAGSKVCFTFNPDGSPLIGTRYP